MSHLHKGTSVGHPVAFDQRLSPLFPPPPPRPLLSDQFHCGTLPRGQRMQSLVVERDSCETI